MFSCHQVVSNTPSNLGMTQPLTVCYPSSRLAGYTSRFYVRVFRARIPLHGSAIDFAVAKPE
jgi:hypothetical protein